MGLFDLFRRKRPRPESAPSAERPALIVALDGIEEPDANVWETQFGEIEPIRRGIQFGGVYDAQAEGGRVLNGIAEFDGQVVRVVGFNRPAPEEIIAKTIETSAWVGEARERLSGHRAHLVLLHESGGTDAAERVIALYKLAAVMGGEELSGVLFESAWTCASAELVREFADRGKLKSIRESLPPILFFGVLPIHEDGETWVATRGCHLYGAPDLVIERGEDDNAAVFDLFHNIFLYVVRQGARVAPGHTMQFGEDLFLKFEALPEDHKFHEWLKGKGTTLLLTRISEEEINRKGKGG